MASARFLRLAARLAASEPPRLLTLPVRRLTAATASSRVDPTSSLSSTSASPSSSAAAASAAVSGGSRLAVPLTQPYPGLPAHATLSDLRSLPPPVTRITTLANGVRVASEDSHGQAAAIGVMVDAGSRYETPELNGVFHVMERMAFRTTEARTTAEISAAFVASHGEWSAQSTRETIAYSFHSLRDHIPHALEVLADAVTKPVFNEEELQQQRELLLYDLESLWQSPIDFIPEVVHEAAYGNHGLGLSQICRPDNVANITSEHLRQYFQRFFVGPRIVVAGVGVQHDEFVKLASAHFGSLPASSPLGEVVREPARYVGGEVFLHADPDAGTKETGAVPQASSEPLTHLALTFQGCDWSDPDIFALCVLNTLLGGGSSFSTGGPGKGMHSRLYRNVLNRYAWVENASALNSPYADSGLFGLFGSARPDKAREMAMVFCSELVAIVTGGIKQQEFVRARNQLKSSLFTALESRIVRLDDVARQVLVYGRRQDAAEVCALLDALQPADLTRVARRVLRTPPTIVAHGPADSVAMLPSQAELATFFSEHIGVA